MNWELKADDKLQTQVSLFYQDRDEIQLKQSLVQSREESNATTFIDFIGNSAAGSNQGVEVEFNWLASEILVLFGSVGLLEVVGDNETNTYTFDITDNDINLRDIVKTPDDEY